MTAQKHTPVRIWCAPEGEYGQGFDAVRLCTWSDRQEYRDGFETQYVRADISDEMLEALREAEEYFDNRADADCDETGFIPNEEMKLLTTVRAALAKAGIKP